MQYSETAAPRKFTPCGGRATLRDDRIAIAFGGNGTRKEFGPVKPKKAKVLKLVRPGQ